MVEKTIDELFDLTGKTALVTGSTGWLGTAFANALAEAGASVVISSRDEERAAAAAAALPVPDGATHHGVALDHMDETSLHSGFEAAVSVAGQLDILVNNGLEGVGKDLTDVSFEEFARHQVNNAGYFELARLLRNHVVERSAGGNVINVGSMYGQVGSYPDAYEGSVASPVAYHALKGGTIHMTRHLAVYWASDNVRVNCLSPGAFPNVSKASAELVERLEAKCPMKRMGQPWELKGALVFLASDASSYVTGQILTIDGGWTAW